MIQVILETDIQDALLDADGDVVVTEDGVAFVAGIPAVVQGVEFRFHLYLAEWFLNEDIGTPYWEELLGSASKKPGVQDRAFAVATANILDTPGVLAVKSLRVTVTDRKMTVVWAASTQFGDTPVITTEVS